MGFAAVFKLLWDLKLIERSSGYMALGLIAYVYFFKVDPLVAQVKSIEGSVDAIRVSQIEERLDAHYAALCMNRGNAVLLELIRKLEAEYRALTDQNYPQKDCELLQQLK